MNGITRTLNGVRIDGYPQAVKLIRLDGAKPRWLADLHLHRIDLEFAISSLDAIESTSAASPVPEALWRSAVMHFFKCFGKSASRTFLRRGTVFKTNPGARAVFDYFLDLRNRHFVHDENSYSQCFPAAVLNRREIEPKIAQVIAVATTANTRD